VLRKLLTYRKTEMRLAWERDGRRCIKCGRYTEAPSHHGIKGADRRRGVDWQHHDFVLTLCVECHNEVEKWSREKFIEFLKAQNYNGIFDRLIQQLEEWYPCYA